MIGKEDPPLQRADSKRKHGTINFSDLVNMGYQCRWKFLETRSIKEIESILCSMHYHSAGSHSKEEKDIFKDIMLVRRQRLNSKFKWTGENKKRIVKVSDAFLQAWEDGFAKAKKMIETLDPAHGEYYIEIILHPDIVFEGECEEWELYNTITYYLNPEIELSIQFWYDPLTKNENKFREEIHVKRDLSWNIEGLGDIELKDSYICYALHILYSHNEWAFEDIIRINNISTEIRITCGDVKF